MTLAALVPAACTSGGPGTATEAPSSRVYAGVFTRTGDLTAARVGHTATLLPNGRVLITGDWNNGSALASAELYDPASGTFTPTANLTAPRSMHTATLLPNGRILIAGGWTNRMAGSALASAGVYDPASGTFAPTGDLTTARANQTATLLEDGRVLIAGGDGPAGSALASAELYDLASGTFTPTGSLTTPRVGHTATLLEDGRVLIAGGDGPAGSALASAELYDPASRSFTRTGDVSAARAHHTATLLPDGRILIAGGWTGASDRGALASAELYDPASRTFNRTGDLTTPREWHTATPLADGHVLIAGGLYNGSALASAELYDPAGGTFIPTGDLTNARAMQTATPLADGRVLIVGGGGGDRPRVAELYR